MIKNFRHVCVLVRDLDRAVRFYRDVLRLKLSNVITIEGKYPETVLGVKAVKLTYAKFFAPNQPKNSPPVFELHYWRNPKALPKKGFNHISFTVDDLDREYKRLKRLGIKFISRPVRAPDSHAKMCFGRDPDGNLIEFTEQLKT